MGAGLLAMVSLWCSGQTASPASQASQLPQVLHGQQNSRLAGSLWERACPRWHRRAIPDRPRRLHRRQASSHRLCKACRVHGLQDHCGSGLARDGIAAVYLPDRVVCIAGKPAPTGYAWPAEFTACRIIVGAGLLAMISLRCTCQTASPASQASQLPQVMQGQQNSRLARIPCGSGLARDGIAAVYLPDRVVCIAGKPAPTGDAWPAEFAACQNPLWERACPR